MLSDITCIPGVDPLGVQVRCVSASLWMWTLVLDSSMYLTDITCIPAYGAAEGTCACHIM